MMTFRMWVIGNTVTLKNIFGWGIGEERSVMYFVIANWRCLVLREGLELLDMAAWRALVTVDHSVNQFLRQLNK